ncbi:MAG: hypothetical protein M3O09_12435 [Acidobacteriota bacterium]|nr:hypothetical protein [Acidobacteriota bacterium]
MKWNVNRIISVVTVTSSVIALALVLQKPAPITEPQLPSVAAVNAQAFQEKIQQLQATGDQGAAPAEIRLTSGEVAAALTEAASETPVTPVAPRPGSHTQAAAAGQQASVISVNSSLGNGAPVVQKYQVDFAGDIARGQFATEIAGKEVYVTLAGHLGSSEGYATFVPTEFKVGDLDIPVSLVNGALQKRLAEQRDQLKLPEGVESIKVENGELVMTKK